MQAKGSEENRRGLARADAIPNRADPMTGMALEVVADALQAGDIKVTTEWLRIIGVGSAVSALNRDRQREGVFSAG